MPLYEYRCPNGHTFEIFHRMADPSPDGCPTCGAGPVEKLLFPVAVHFKGSGFYSTDYGKGSRKAAAKDGDSGAATEKPAEKPAGKPADQPAGEKKASAD